MTQGVASRHRRAPVCHKQRLRARSELGGDWHLRGGTLDSYFPIDVIVLLSNGMDMKFLAPAGRINSKNVAVGKLSVVCIICLMIVWHLGSTARAAAAGGCMCFASVGRERGDEGR